MYDKVALKFPDCSTPTNSGISTPAQTSEQSRLHVNRLACISSVPAAKRLNVYNSDVANIVEAMMKPNWMTDQQTRLGATGLPELCSGSNNGKVDEAQPTVCPPKASTKSNGPDLWSS